MGIDPLVLAVAAFAAMVILPVVVWNVRVARSRSFRWPAQKRHFGDPAVTHHRSFRELTIDRGDRPPIAGWYVYGDPALPLVIVSHAFGSTKEESMSRLELLPEGCPVVLFDHKPELETIVRDLHDELRAVMAYARTELGARRIVLWACSLTTLVASRIAADGEVEALVLEEPWPHLRLAIEDRLQVRFPRLPSWVVRPGTSRLARRMSGDYAPPLRTLARNVSGLRVVLITAQRHRRGRAAARAVTKTWRGATIAEVRVAARHGHTIEVARTWAHFGEPLKRALSEAILRQAEVVSIAAAGSST